MLFQQNALTLTSPVFGVTVSSIESAEFISVSLSKRETKVPLPAGKPKEPLLILTAVKLSL